MPPAAPAVENPALGLLRAVRRGFELVFLAALPLGFLGLFAFKFGTGAHAFDFHTFWASGRDVLHGRSPYPASMPAVAHRTSFRPFVYPAPAAVAMVPFSLIPYAVADALWAVLGVAAVAGALRLLGVRDWRCYGATFASVPFCSAIGNGTISALLVLGCAAFWRYRARPWAAGALLAALVVFKLYLWPLGLFLLATRRFKATALSVLLAGAAAVAGWAAIGFAGLRAYPHLLDRLTALVAGQSYSPYALFRALGESPAAARLLMLLFGGALLAAVVAYGRRSDDETPAFALAVGASLALSPIVWPHYLLLCFVPLAVTRRRFGFAWAAPFALWLVTSDWSRGDAGVIAATLAVMSLVLAYPLYGGRIPRRVLVARAQLAVK